MAPKTFPGLVDTEEFCNQASYEEENETQHNARLGQEEEGLYNQFTLFLTTLAGEKKQKASG